MPKILLNAYHFDCQLFHQVNQYFDHKGLNLFFRIITRLGGATITDCIDNPTRPFHPKST